MPVPKRKHSRARRDKKHANKGLDIKAFAQCNNCGDAIAAHVVCQGCGFYKGKKVLRTKSDRGLTRDEAHKAQENKRAQNQPAEQPEVQEASKE